MVNYWLSWGVPIPTENYYLIKYRHPELVSGSIAINLCRLMDAEPSSA